MSGDWTVTDMSPIASPCPEDFSEGDEAVDEEIEKKDVSLLWKQQNAKFKWLSVTWPMKEYEGKLPMNKRKAEWFRFRDQFERIASGKPDVDPMTKLTALKIQGGDHLLSIIEMQEKSIKGPCCDIFVQVKEALNNYFNKMCDPSKERMKFREMEMAPEEVFEDWILRLENQAKFCDFSTDEQRDEEFLQAITRRSIPEISLELYKISGIFNKDVQKLITHGQHLDYMRREMNEKENKKESNGEVADGTSETKQINAVRHFERNNYRNRVERPWNSSRGRQPNRMPQGYMSRPRKDCGKCGSTHGPRNCRAFGKKCHKCDMIGHFAQLCRNPKPMRTVPKEVEDSKKDVRNEVNQINKLVGESNMFQKDNDPRIVECKIGAEKLEFLVDSGATVNTITTKVWDILKKNCRTVMNEVVMFPEDIIKSYANEKPMDVLCSFMAYIGITSQMTKIVLAKFFVIRGTKLSLLSYETACNLKILHIGPIGTINWTDVIEVKSIVKESPKVPIEGIKFRVNKDIPPKQIIRYNIPKAFERDTNARLQSMQEKGIIERADKENYKITSVSPLVLVPKGTNDFRIVVDYREVNKAIIREPYPMPSLEKIWTEIPSGGGSLFFSKLDLKDAYFHIELHEDVRHYTTFMTSNGLMRFKRLPFGLSCAPELFQKVMERILINCKNIIIYLDDILVFANSLDELKAIVAKVKDVLRINNMEVNEKKSMYNQTSIDFLGFTLDGSGILPAQKKICDIELFQRPKDLSELRSFLGLLTFISPFIKNFSHKTKVLRDLLTSKVKFVWTEQHQTAFEDLKVSAQKDLVKRGYFNENDDTILYTDASPWGLGAVLVQKSTTTEEHRIIACASKSLTDTECRYPQLHREALGIVWGMERFAYYLLGRHFTLRSDSKALKFMIENVGRKDVGKRIMTRAEGWFLRLEHFSYKFEHVSGLENIADAASRICQRKNDAQFGSGREPHELCAVTSHPNDIREQYFALTLSDIKQELESDLELQNVISWIDKNEKWPKEILKYQAFQEALYMQDELLMKNEKLVLPKTLHERALHLAHLSHPGCSIMKHFLRQGLWWLGIDRDVEFFVRSCKECQLVVKVCKPLPITTNGLPNNAWEFIAMDFSSPSDTQKWKAIVFTDYYSRFLVAVPMDKTDTEATKKVLKRIFRTYGIPAKIKLDNGPPFNSEELKQWLLNQWGVSLTHTTPLNPTENGLVERSMQGINKIASISKINKNSFNEALADYVACYNSWPHSVTKVPPAELMFGRPVRTLFPNAKLYQPVANDEELRDRDLAAKFMRNKAEDKRRNAGPTDINVGDLVLVMQQKHDKADSIYKNSLNEVINIEGAGRVTLKDQESGRVYARNVKHLKKYVDRNETPKFSVAAEEEAPKLKDNNEDEVMLDASALNNNVSGEPARKSSRIIKPSKRFDDFHRL